MSSLSFVANYSDRGNARLLAAVLKEVDGLVLEDVPIPEPGFGGGRAHQELWFLRNGLQGNQGYSSQRDVPTRPWS